MKLFKFLLLAVFSLYLTSGEGIAQTYTHDGTVKLTKVPNAKDNHVLTAITNRGVIVKTDVLVSSIGSGGGVSSVNDGYGISVDETDTANPIVTTNRVSMVDFITDSDDLDRVLTNNNAQDEAAMSVYMENAIAYCKTNDIRTLFFPNGLYRFEQVDIDDVNSFKFIGDKAIIKWDNLVGAKATWNFTNSNKVTIQGFVFRNDIASYDNVSHLWIGTGCGDFNIFDNEFYSIRRSAIIAENLSGGASSEGVYIHDNFFGSSTNHSNELQSAISLLENSDYSRIINNSFKGVPSAIRLTDGSNTLIAFNTILASNGLAYDGLYNSGIIYVEPDSNNGKIDIVYNKINHNETGMIPLVIKGSVGVTNVGFRIIGNDLLINGSSTKSIGIYLKGGENSLVQGNKLQGISATPTDDAIIFDQSNGAIVSDNYMNYYDNGISLLNSSDVELQSNTFENITSDDITLTGTGAIYELPAYDDDTAAGVGGLLAGEKYQTTGSGASPLNVAGLILIKQ